MPKPSPCLHRDMCVSFLKVNVEQTFKLGGGGGGGGDDAGDAGDAR